MHQFNSNMSRDNNMSQALIVIGQTVTDQTITNLTVTGMETVKEPLKSISIHSSWVYKILNIILNTTKINNPFILLRHIYWG